MLDVFRDLFSQTKTGNLYKFKAYDSSKLKFTGDLIHLTPNCGEMFVYNLFEQANELYDNVSKYSSTVKASDKVDEKSIISRAIDSLIPAAILSDSDNESYLSVQETVATDDLDVTVVPASSKSPVTLDMLYAEIRKTNEVMLKVNSHDNELVNLRQTVTSGFKSTDIAIAKIYEDQDFVSNLSKENRVTIGSMKLDDSNLPVDRSSWIVFMSAKVNAIIKDLFQPDSQLVPVLVGVAIRFY